MSDFDPFRPFLTEWAYAAGMTKRELSGTAYRQVFRGVHISSVVPDSLVVRARGAVLRAPGHALLSHDTSAQLWVPSWPGSSEIHLSFSRSVKSIGEGIRTHRFTYPMERWHRHGLPLTGPSMTFIHMAVRTDLVELVCFGDRLVARKAISPEELLQGALAWEGHGRRAAISAAQLVRERSESVPETQARLLMVFAGLPEPMCNHPYKVGEVERYRLDLAWPEFKVALEYDGRWHDKPEQRRKDTARRKEMRQAGWIIIVIRADDLYDRPDDVVHEVASALCQRGCSVRANQAYQRWFQPRGMIA